jgi:MazG family protein
MASSKYLLDEIELSSMSQFHYAEQLQKEAAKVGFDWPDVNGIVSKIREEITEIEREIDTNADKETVAAELGDLLFACVNLARHLEIDTEQAIALTNNKFIKRFNYIEDVLNAKNKTVFQANLDEMDALWNEAKLKEIKT